jgi:hypothetical protein
MSEIKYKIANFLDEFYSADLETKKQMIEKFPLGKIKEKKHAAYVAAMVEDLCLNFNLEIPDWVFNKKYSLKEPYFVGGLESLKAFLLVESPLSFRRRNIFVSENVLKRA